MSSSRCGRRESGQNQQDESNAFAGIIAKRKHDCKRRIFLNRSHKHVLRPTADSHTKFSPDDDAISCWALMIASPAYSSSVVCPPCTYTLARLSPLRRDVARAGGARPLPQASPGNENEGVRVGVIVAMGIFCSPCVIIHVCRCTCWLQDLATAELSYLWGIEGGGRGIHR